MLSRTLPGKRQQVDDFEGFDVERPARRPAKLAIVHRGLDFVVVNKPAGMWPRHALFDEPGVFDVLASEHGFSMDTLANIYPLEPDVSGLSVLATDAAARNDLVQQFETGRMTVTYQAIVRAMVMTEGGVCELPLRDASRGVGRTRVDRETGTPARTEWRLADRFVGFALLECIPRNRVEFQLRAHLEALGMPLAVDRVFGSPQGLMLSSFKSGYRPSRRKVERPLIDRASLHAARIELDVPGGGGERLTLAAELPRDFRAALHQLDRFGRAPK